MRIVIGTRTSFRNDYLPFVNEFLPLGYLLLANVSVISETIELDIVLGVFRWFEIFECCPKETMNKSPERPQQGRGKCASPGRLVCR